MERDKHCFNCTHYHPGKLDFVGLISPRSCAAGHTDICNKWWEDNGKKKFADETIEELPCFEPTESAKFLDSMIDKVEKLNVAVTKLVDDIKNNPA